MAEEAQPAEEQTDSAPEVEITATATGSSDATASGEPDEGNSPQASYGRANKVIT